jgi:hypothetical protein
MSPCTDVYTLAIAMPLKHSAKEAVNPEKYPSKLA